MPNLIDKLITKVDTLRQRAADKFGLPAFDMYRVIRTYSSGIIGEGNYTETQDIIYPTPVVKLSGEDVLEHGGRFSKRSMAASEISLTYVQGWFYGEPKGAGQEVFYKLAERNGQGQATTYWQLITIPLVQRDEINWVLEFKPYVVCPTEGIAVPVFGALSSAGTGTVV